MLNNNKIQTGRAAHGCQRCGLLRLLTERWECMQRVGAAFARKHGGYWSERFEFFILIIYEFYSV
jgi:chorismate mutase